MNTQSKPLLGGNKLGGGLLGKQADTAVQVVKLSENQRIEDISDRETLMKFIDALNKINGVSTKKVGVAAAKQENIDLENNNIEDTIKEIRKETEDILLGDLMGLAHQADDCKAIVEEIREDFDTNRNDVSVSSHARQIPTPFIVRYVGRIERKAIELSESLASYESRFQTSQNATDENEYIEFLTQQTEAIKRLSTSVAELSDKVDNVRTQSMNKLKISANTIKEREEAEDEDNSSATATQIKRKYELFLQEEKKQNEKISEKTDLFGVSLTAASAPQKTGFGLGGGLGGGGLKSTSTATSTASAIKK
ncbi:hypothetical protein TVAG_044940 [Trichomonas vaginalis G3]|uniref:Uncharacterized protein n=1 Tax=Trichomonas vaginalis (strain ATCC PRA-98 / G3) TaxID=412133 RepID=A2E8E2_TRIV3|nr:hypothetical protein TVAGG3_0550860 [Trichomonas vaginalis G3]EAY11070.1 hypothetical protein TVAG_044940 [Trichomonas vaginalis G3]KAI5520493.1 hypothetical protein TVAGG3_0550860 [Trichomonas vaginalis G3]|eukprot:XP_001323293.1 hypothetical protein [Trichomonas vaginalis G3]